jgi:NADH pyrophosphatase NudC (nudix superfamily)
MELWDAYDRNGNRTGETLVRGEPIPDGRYHLVCEVLVRHMDGSYLCMKRAQNKDLFPGRYEATAGGSALQGETALDCVRRELLEETGISCDEYALVAKAVFDDKRYIAYSYTCNVDVDKNAITFQEGETEEYKWLTEAEFIAFINSGEMLPTQYFRYREYFSKCGYLR